MTKAESEFAREIRIPSGEVKLNGELQIPSNARGLVLFAHGSGSSRHSPRNQYVARVIRERDVGTLLFDLLTPEEEAIDRRTRHLRFDIGEKVGAVVSRGGRPDLAGEALTRVISPTLLIVGGLDDVVIQLNEEALQKLRCKKELRIVPGATHLFEEPGTLEDVAHLAQEWFFQFLQAQPTEGN